MIKTPKNATKPKQAKNAPVPDRWVYGVEEAARLLSISRGKLYQMILAGEVVSFKAGKRRLISAEALKAWLVNAQEAA